MNKLTKYIKIQLCIYVSIFLLSLNIYDKYKDVSELHKLDTKQECGVIKTYDKIYATKSTSYLPVESKNFKWWVVVNNSDINSYKLVPVKYCVNKSKLLKNDLYYKTLVSGHNSFTISITLVFVLLVISFCVFVCNDSRDKDYE